MNVEGQLEPIRGKMAKPRQILSIRERLLIIALYEHGKTDAQIAKILDMPRKTLTDVCKHNGITATIKKNKVKPNDRVEKSLYMRANGYEYTEAKVETEEIQIKGSKDGETVFVPAIKTKTTITPKHMPADVTACIYWTKNRDPQRWKDRRDIAFDEESPLLIEIAKNITHEAKKS